MLFAPISYRKKNLLSSRDAPTRGVYKYLYRRSRFSIRAQRIEERHSMSHSRTTRVVQRVEFLAVEPSRYTRMATGKSSRRTPEERNRGEKHIACLIRQRRRQTRALCVRSICRFPFNNVICMQEYIIFSRLFTRFRPDRPVEGYTRIYATFFPRDA